MLGIGFCELKWGRSENASRMIDNSSATKGLTLQFLGQLSVLLFLVIVCPSGAL
jgi:hypothetical protein